MLEDVYGDEFLAKSDLAVALMTFSFTASYLTLAFFNWKKSWLNIFFVQRLRESFDGEPKRVAFEVFGSDGSWAGKVMCRFEEMPAVFYDDGSGSASSVVSFRLNRHPAPPFALPPPPICS